MRKTINCFIPYTESTATDKTITTLKGCSIVNKIYLLSINPDTTLSLPQGCEILPVDSLTSSKTMNAIAQKADTPFTLLYTKTSPLELEPMALERMVTVLQENRSGMVYADHYEWKDGEKKKHPVIDYQAGSVRDDFDFGSVLVFKSQWMLAAICSMPACLMTYAALYFIRLFVSNYASLKHINEYLYTEIESDNRTSGEKQFDYVDPRNRKVQVEMEKVFTKYLQNIDACMEENPLCIDPQEGTFAYEASIIIPVRNRARTIEDAIRSALSQETTFPFNVIVVDNHSTDGTTEIINKYSDRKELLHLQPERTDLGIGGCWSLAANHPLCGRFAVQLDSDDLYSDTHTLQTIVDTFYKEECAMVIGTYRMTDFDLNTIAPGVIDHREWTENNGRNNALRINGLGAPRAFYTPLLRKIGIPNVSYGEDYALGLAFSRQYKIGRIYDVLYLCRRWEGNSDAALDIEKVNANNYYKDSLRTQEIAIRKDLYKSLYWSNDSGAEIYKINKFIQRQLTNWQLAAENHKALENVQTKELNVCDNPFTVQFNPQRSVSSTAKVDEKSIKERPCFLCAENQPKEQKRYPIERYNLCVNPYPILPKHVTLVDMYHTPQKLPYDFADDIDTTLPIMPDFALFYNGAHCGASAPDHYHLQGVKSQDVPLIKNIWSLMEHAQIIDTEFDFIDEGEEDGVETNTVWLYLNTHYPCPLFIIKGSIYLKSANVLERLLQALPKKKGEKEPRFNLLTWKVDGEEEEYFTIIFPRSKHRPDRYFAEGEEQMLISPGTLDMAGVLVTTRQEDFDRLTEQDAADILKEVGLSIKDANKVIERYFTLKATPRKRRKIKIEDDDDDE